MPGNAATRRSRARRAKNRVAARSAQRTARRVKQRAANVGERYGDLPPDLEAARQQLREVVVRVTSWGLEYGEGPELVSATWNRLEAAITQAFEARDAAGAIEAIERWESHARRVLLHANDGG